MHGGVRSMVAAMAAMVTQQIASRDYLGGNDRRTLRGLRECALHPKCERLPGSNTVRDKCDSMSSALSDVMEIRERRSPSRNHRALALGVRLIDLESRIAQRERRQDQKIERHRSRKTAEDNDGHWPFGFTARLTAARRET